MPGARTNPFIFTFAPMAILLLVIVAPSGALAIAQDATPMTLVTPASSGVAAPQAGESTNPTPTPANPTPNAPTVASDPRAEALSGLFRSFSADETIYTQHLITLSNPFFEGRAPGTRGNMLAAEYIEFYFRTQLGLEPAFPETTTTPDDISVSTPFASFQQPFQRGTELKVSSESLLLAQAAVVTPPDAPDASRAALADTAIVVLAEADLVFKPGSDFNTLGFSGSGEATGPLVSAGYAIDSGPKDFKSFPEGKTDLTGKIVLVFRFEPLNERGRSRLVDEENGPAFTPAASMALKIGAVVRRGAAGVILVNPPGVDDPRAGVLETVTSTQQMMASQPVPIVMMSAEGAERLLTALGSSLMAARRAADEGKQVQSFGEQTLRLQTDVKRVPVKTQNVAAVLRGRGSLADEYIIIGGHYDHLGYGFFGSRDPKPRGVIHNGADDNASGTAGVLLVARQLVDAYAALPKGQNARSFIFVAFSAEESGLHGARHFVRSAPIAADKTFAMINMDMIGRLRSGKIDIDGVGTATQWRDIIDPLISRYPLVPTYGKSGRGPSDHAEFFGAGVPVLHFFTGLHPEYHTSADLYTTTNPLGAVVVTRLISDVAMDIATRQGKLTFQNSRARSSITGDREDIEPTPIAPVPDARPAPAHRAPLSSTSTPNVPATTEPATPARAGASENAEPAQPAPGRAGPMGGMRVRFGIAPGEYSGEDGVVVGDVYPDTSAAEAGLKEGDRMTRWNDKALTSVEEWMPLLISAKPGDKVRIKYVRAGKELETTTTLKGREAPRND